MDIKTYTCLLYVQPVRYTYTFQQEYRHHTYKITKTLGTVNKPSLPQYEDENQVNMEA